jgi:hypothetical protein
MSTRNYIKAGFTAATLAFVLGACDDSSPSSPSSLSTPADVAPQQAVAGVGQGTAALIAALNNVAVVVQEVAVLSNIGQIQVVNVEDVLNNTDILRNARFLNNITILQDFLNNTLNNNNVEILNNFLNQNNIAIDDVVAIDVLSGGDITIFVQGQ